MYYKTTLLYQQQQLFLEHVKNYDDPTSPAGMNVAQFLRDIIYNPETKTKDRLEAVKLLINYTGKMKKYPVVIVDDVVNSPPSPEDKDNS